MTTVWAVAQVHDGRLKALHEEAWRLLHHLAGPLPQIVRLPGGKPVVADGSCHISVSHHRAPNGGGVVAAAISDYPVGVDVLTHRSYSAPLKSAIARMLALQREDVDSWDDTDWSVAWTCLESEVKRTGTGPMRCWSEPQSLKVIERRTRTYVNPVHGIVATVSVTQGQPGEPALPAQCIIDKCHIF